jgi:putative alpha-1,2-mannosidase
VLGLLQEIDADGKVVHYSPYEIHGGVHPGPLVTDNGFWDTFRTVYPLLSLLYPDYLGDIIQGSSVQLVAIVLNVSFVPQGG